MVFHLNDIFPFLEEMDETIKPPAKHFYESVMEKFEFSSNDLKFRIFMIFIIFFTILIRFNFFRNFNTAISFGIVIILCQYFLTYNILKQNKKNTEGDINLSKLDRDMNKSFSLIFTNKYNSVLYKNPEIVKIFIKLQPFIKFDNRNYKESLVSANQLIRVHQSAIKGQKNPNQTIDIAEQLQRDIMNHLQSMIHSFPSTEISRFRFTSYLKLMQQATQKIINDLKVIYEYHYQQVGPNIYSPPPNERSGPWRDPTKTREYGPNWNFYY